MDLTFISTVQYMAQAVFGSSTFRVIVEPGVAVHSVSPVPQGARADLCESEASLVYRVSSRTARTI